MSRIALFAGSFDPFTSGHDDVLRRGLGIFDRVVVGIGTNTVKKCLFSPEERRDAIIAAYEGDGRVDVALYEGLTTDFAKKCGAGFLLRSVRNAVDFEYEKNLAEVNSRLFGLETVLLMADPRLSFVSSSMVRELLAFGKTEDAERFVVGDFDLPSVAGR